MSNIRNIIMTLASVLFGLSLFDCLYGFKNIIIPGISQIYNELGTQITPNMVTLVVFDWRGYDTLGEALVLVTAITVVLLLFGNGKLVGDEND